jgi:hypothetical protein
MKQNIKKQVVLLASHTIDDFILRQYHKLKKAAYAIGDVYLLIHHEKEISGELKLPDDVLHYSFCIDSLNELQYTPIADTIVPCYPRTRIR